MKNNANGYESELRSAADDRHLITLLSHIYLEAGLPLELAIRSALADYELFHSAPVCEPVCAS